ncbi:ParB N-terminal domain-containing protein [Candidatus Woesearchaeota archaeon]|nr:ParB N-terminal domain-containing protein [Candidatus Woesearchaeota archaeon]
MEVTSQFALIDPEKIGFDEKNPRGEDKDKIEADDEFKKLLVSVKEHNILVPLIVRNSSGKKPYKLVDGERRLRAALNTKKKLVPAHILDDDEVDGRILAYNVHMLRKQWGKVSEINSIKEIRDELKKKHKNISGVELFRKLLEVTNHKKHELVDLLILLKYGDDIIEKVQNQELAMSYLIQIDMSFISPFKREFPQLYKSYGDKNLRKILVKKAEHGKLGSTRYLMDNVVELFRDKENKTKFKNSIKKFLDKGDEDIRDTVENFKVKTKPKKTTTRKTTKSTKVSTKSKKSTKVPKPLDHKSQLVELEAKIIQDNVFDLLFNYLKESVIEFEKRTKMKFSNEKDLQNFIYSILRSLFSSIEFEDPTEKMCERSNRLDFVIKDHRIIIEVKFVRDKAHAKNIYKELAEDYPKYLNSPYGENIINYIYDPGKNLTNHSQFKKHLEKLLPKANHYIQ